MEVQFLVAIASLHLRFLLVCHLLRLPLLPIAVNQTMMEDQSAVKLVDA
jgi:hypothetical protein